MGVTTWIFYFKGPAHHGPVDTIRRSTDCALPRQNAVVSRSISFLCTCLYSPTVLLLLSNDVLKFTGLFPALSPQIHQPTVASVHNSKRSSQTPKCRAEAWGAFTRLHTTSLCVCSSLTTVREGWDSRVPRNSPDLDPGCLCSLSDTCGGLWMSLWWDWGTGMVKNTQSFISHPWHRSHSDTDTHWDTKTQLLQVADLHTTLDTNATQLHLAL